MPMDKKKELILHIGRSKSGTSTLQHYLTRHRKTLSAQGICYPVTGCSGRVAQHEIALACRNPIPRSRALRDMRRAFWKEVAPFDQVIVSSEAFQNLLAFYNLDYFFGGGGVNAMLRAVAPRAFDRPYHIKTIAYVRELLEYACSSYSQNVQNSDQKRGLVEYCNKVFKRFKLRAFFSLWKSWSDQSMFVYYSRKRLFNRDIVEDFFRRATIELPAPVTNTDANPTISGNLLAFKLLLNRHNHHCPTLYGTFAELARLEPRYRGRLFVPDQLASTLRAKFGSYNAQLAQQTGDNIEEISFESGNRFDPKMWRDDVERFLSHPELAPLKSKPAVYGTSPEDAKRLLECE